MIGVKPYETGSPKCRNFGMSDSAKYPGLCKPYETERNAGNEYVELDYNSINTQQNPSTYFTYKTEYDNERKVGTSSSTRNNAQTSFQNRNYNTNANNEVNSFSSEHQEQKTTNQQQYSNQQSYQQNPSLNSSPEQQQQQPNRYQTSAFQQAFTSFQQQHQQKRTIDKNNPFHSYRWNLLFKNYL